MAIKKSDDLANESNSKYNNVKTAQARAKITERFDDTTHNEQPSDEALQFLNKKVDEVIDALNTNTSKTGITSGQASAITANTSKVTNSNQSKADINALDITEVGTISSGVWQGTTIKTAYIGDDQVTEDKLANTLLAEIDANTAKTGFATTMPTATADHTVALSVTNNRGTYALVFTMVDSSGRTPVTKTATIALE